MFKRTLKLGIVLFLFALFCKMLIIAWNNIEVKEFQPVSTVFLLDTSASNRELFDKQVQTVLRISKRLDSEDHTLIYVVTEDTYNVYNGNPHKLVDIKKAIKKRSTLDSKAFGTAYGLALKKAVGDVLEYKQNGYKPAIIVLGDLENEGDITKQINWNVLPKNMEKTLKYAPDLTIAFLYAHPQKLDEIRQSLLPIMGDEKMIVASEENVDQAIRKFLDAVGR